MLDLDPAAIRALPVDDLAMRVLADMKQTGEWNEHNYLLTATDDPAAARAVSEATGWLRAHGCIARTPQQSEHAAIFITRHGEEVLARGLDYARAVHSLQDGLHPLIETVARPQFLLGQYENAVFVAMKAVEIRVRALAGLGDDSYGVTLMNTAFGENGPLTDQGSERSERDGTRFLFAGAYSVLRNPAGHREVNYDDVAEAAEAVGTASLLMRILDRIERRLAGP